MATTLNVPPPTTTTAPPQMKKEEEKVDYLNLPCPIPYEEIHREALSLCLSLSLIFHLELLQSGCFLNYVLFQWVSVFMVFFGHYFVAC